MIRAAISSSAFIGASQEQVLEIARLAGAEGIEWTDDGFIQPGDYAEAADAMIATLRAGLSTVSYAVTFRVGSHGRAAFALALGTARELNAPILRLWSGPKRATTDGSFVDEARRLGDEAGSKGVTLCFGIAADSTLGGVGKAARLLGAVDHPFVKLAWEPCAGRCFDVAMEDAGTACGRIGLVVARADEIDGEGSELEPWRGAEAWMQYMDAFDEQGGNPDMARYIVLRTSRGAGASDSLDDGDQPRGIDRDLASIKSWASTLRRYRRRRLY